jgi:flagellar hook-associated protein 2
MARIQATTGLVSGIPIDQTVTELMSIANQPVTALQNQDTTLTNEETALDQLSALLLTMQTACESLGQANLFQQTTATSSDSSALGVTVTGSPAVGTYQFTPIQTVQSQQWLGAGMASTTNPLGGGSLSFRYGNSVDQGVSLSVLNGGKGFSPGEIRITDASGASAVVNLSAAQTIDDVINDINNAGTISVTASADGDHLVLTDTSGGSGALKVQEVAGGSTAASLGLTNLNLTTGAGSSILSLSSNTPLSALNDGLGVATNTVLPDISYTLRDGESGTIDLSPLSTGASQAQRETTLGQVLNEITTAINGTSGTPKVSLQIQGNQLVMQDLTTQVGNHQFSLQAINGSGALAGLGLTGAAVGNTITGSPILGGLKTVLLADLNGGQGLGTLGQLSLTDAAGHSVTVDLSGQTTLQGVMDSINTAAASATTPVDIVASVNSAGDGIQLTDTSGNTQGSLTAADTQDGTGTASKLGIAGSSDTGVIQGSDLDLAAISGSTTLASLNGGAGVAQGTLFITDSAGNTATLDLRNQNIQTVEDVVDAINQLKDCDVHAQIDPDGNGIEILDRAHGGGTLAVTEGNSTTAKDLHLLGAASTQTINGTPTQVLDGSMTTTIQTDQGVGTLGQLALTDAAGHSVTVNLAGLETVQDVIDAINTSAAAAGVDITASVNSAGDGLELTDTSGGTQGSLTAANTQDGTNTATKLGIAGSTSTGVIQGSDLHLAAISDSTTLASLNGGAGVAQGTLTITDSAGTSDTLNLATSNIQTVGDLINAINSLKCNVHAEIDPEGYGIAIQDQAHGTGLLTVTEGNSTTAQDLHLLTPASTQTVDGTPTQVVDGSMITTVSLNTTDSLSDLVTAINNSGAGVTASILSDGSSTPYHLVITANQAGSAARMVLSTSGLGFSIRQTAAPQNALLQMGSSGLLISSPTNNFSSALPGATLQVQQGTGQPVTVNVTTSDANLASALQTLVTDYNQFQQQWTTATQYTSSTNTEAVLTNDYAANQVNSQLTSLLSGQFSGVGSLQSLAALGVTFNNDGTLTFDQSTLDAAFAANPSAVQQFFITKTYGFADQINNLITQLGGKTNSLISNEVQGLSQTVTQNQQQITEMQAHLANEENQLYSQFDAMETAIAQMRSDLNVVEDIAYISSSGTSSSSSSSSSSSNSGNLLTSGLSSMGSSSTTGS